MDAKGRSLSRYWEINNQPEVKIADAEAKAAVQLMYDTIAKHKITPADVLSWDEEPSRRPFVGGQSVFLRNWSYTWATAQDKAESQVIDKVGVAPLPHFPGKSSADSAHERALR